METPLPTLLRVQKNVFKYGGYCYSNPRISLESGCTHTHTPAHTHTPTHIPTPTHTRTRTRTHACRQQTSWSGCESGIRSANVALSFILLPYDHLLIVFQLCLDLLICCIVFLAYRSQGSSSEFSFLQTTCASFSARRTLSQSLHS